MKDLNQLNEYRLKEYERKIYGAAGDGGNGVFKVFVSGRSFHVIVSNGGGWDHVSVTPCNLKRKTCPTWEEMCAIKNMFFNEDEIAIEYHPAKEDYVNMHPYCLHLWKPQNEDIPKPP